MLYSYLFTMKTIIENNKKCNLNILYRYEFNIKKYKKKKCSSKGRIEDK